MTTPTDPPPRRPLDPDTLAAALARAGWEGPAPVLLGAVPSTNAEIESRALAGAAEGLVVVAEEQTAGRGRLGRRWDSPASSGLTWSVLLRPDEVPQERYGWLPLLTGVAVAGALRDATGVPVALKWPNDLVVDGPDRAGGPGPRKLGGILLERLPAAGSALVVGVGLNVDSAAAELPVDQATSLAVEGADPVREDLLAAALTALGRRYRAWRSAGGDPVRSGLREAYRTACLTVGRPVRVRRAGEEDLVGTAVDVDDDGRLLVRPDGATSGASLVAVAAGDVLHVRAPGAVLPPGT
ncbi:MAG: biotin--[acetyl-CoA-carboxylase] ligase [Candidatus Nanopelagicales bacterium]